MFRLSTSTCPFCAASAFIKSSIPIAQPTRPSWQHSRQYASVYQEKRKPSRMQLSARVTRPPPPPPPMSEDIDSRRPPPRKSRNSPFGGMNQTRAPQSVQLVTSRNRISAAERKRQTRMAPPGARGKDDKEDRDPMKALRMQRRLAGVSYERRSRLKIELAERDTFEEFALLEAVKTSIPSQALRGMTDLSPTPIQRLAIPALLDTEPPRKGRALGPPTLNGAGKELKSFLLAAETGSGKTLAYVLPVIDALKRAEAAEEAEMAAEKARNAADIIPDALYALEPPQLSNAAHHTTARPRAIILVPTAELVDQVGALIKSFAHTVKFRAALLSAAYSATVIKNRLFTRAGIDLVVTTPHLLLSITESDPNILARCTHLVIDEADSLLDRSFSPTTQGVIDRVNPSLRQIIFCSATIPRSLDSYLHKRYPATRRLATPNLHAIPRRVALSVVDIDKIPYQGNRDLACAQVIYDIGKNALEDEGGEAGAEAGAAAELAADPQRQTPVKKVIVFVNEREKALELANFLALKGIDALAIHRDSDHRKQAEILSRFTTPHGHPSVTASTSTSSSSAGPSTTARADAAASPPPGTRKLAHTTVLVTTDITSRGIDTYPVRDVILYDVPHTSIDFIHRLGRVGRMGRRGRGVVLVGKHDRKDIVKEVREGMFRGAALI